ncbi:hypothetical protein METBIDRAFT_76531 [Metschnikowia bicuspidata var. bicuspidata NRRL YB-4993]|uniref:Uncharacterized protein n=1 Tax=Metschnikowia bicuspidata var. bicuspidata NRRL YB-4993 TaxID=869754 RepID=A0A1A0HH73_9ASCO|nr:hypothetical protein METBIDRAFT_76531 [Metschnikowia bicuspidata var. bicuspidata NRRL YB-4993]OBA23529.1 hypothetical protein METBIDRAFT_76531 [Metschnikowia bicuspidata var. bicuspidata NRRL YB-4993]
MWPFTSGDKSSDTLDKELPQSLKEFFKETDPSHRLNDLNEDPREAQVQEVLASQSNEYNDEFDQYKHRETPRKVASVNCAELLQAVVTCYRGWLFLGNDCSDEIVRTKICMEIQQEALKKLRYQDCCNKRHCTSIRAFTDKLFTAHFGQYGEKIDDETRARFDVALNEAFAAVWKKEK